MFVSPTACVLLRVILAHSELYDPFLTTDYTD
jgi:hypothetical protein